MYSKIFAFAFVAYFQIAAAQTPTAFPNPLGAGSFTPPFLGSFNTNWVRPYYTAAAEGWRNYFEQLQQARNQLYQTLTNIQNTAQNTTGAARDTITQILSAIPVHTKHANADDETQPQILGDLQAPAVEVPAHHEIHETQVVTTVTRPQVQSDIQHVRPQGQIEVQHVRPQGQVSVQHVTQGQTTARQPQTVGLQTVTTNTRPLTSSVTSGVVSQVPQVPQIVPQIGSQVPTWVGK